MYIVELGPETLPLIGERCRGHQYEYGRIEGRNEDKPLAFRVFIDKKSHVTQGSVQRNCDPARFTPCLFHTQLRAGYNTYVILFL